MKHLFAFLLFSTLIFSSCKKEDKDDDWRASPTYPNFEWRVDYFKGRVVDSVTGFPVLNARVSYCRPYVQVFSMSDAYSDINGIYTGSAYWNYYTNNLSLMDSVDMYLSSVSTTGYGFVKCKGYQLINADTTIFKIR